MRFFDRTLSALCSAALIAAVATPLYAAGAEEDAKTLFAKGRELRIAGNCGDAITVFRRALEIYPEGLGALRNVAECEETLSLYASARRDWWDLRRAALQSNEPRYKNWSNDAETHYKALATNVATLTIELAGERGNPAIRVLVDGKPLDPRLLGVALERDGGAHVIEVFYGGAASLTQKVDLALAARRVVKFTIPGSGASAADPARSTPAPLPAASARRAQPLRTAGFIGLGIGGAGLIATAVAFGLRTSALSDVEAGCTAAGDSYTCPPDLQDRYETGKTASTLVNVFAGVALVGLGAGVTLLILNSSGATPPSAHSGPSAALSITAMPGGAGSRFLVTF